MTTTSPGRAGTGGSVAGAGRAAVGARTLRTDRWWLQPLLTVIALVAFIAYSTLRAFENANYYAAPYISPFYSPCITTHCEGSHFPQLFTGPAFISPALYILVVLCVASGLASGAARPIAGSTVGAGHPRDHADRSV